LDCSSRPSDKLESGNYDELKLRGLDCTKKPLDSGIFRNNLNATNLNKHE
jgi:hypothetical protein